MTATTQSQTPTLVNAIHDHIALLDEALWDVCHIARNLESVGLNKPADELAGAIHGLRQSAKAISDAHMAETNSRIRSSQELTGNMLLLALNGCIQPSKKAMEKA